MSRSRSQPGLHEHWPLAAVPKMGCNSYSAHIHERQCNKFPRSPQGARGTLATLSKSGMAGKLKEMIHVLGHAVAAKLAICNAGGQ